MYYTISIKTKTANGTIKKTHTHNCRIFVITAQHVAKWKKTKTRHNKKKSIKKYV